MNYYAQNMFMDRKNKCQGKIKRDICFEHLNNNEVTNQAG